MYFPVYFKHWKLHQLQGRCQGGVAAPRGFKKGKIVKYGVFSFITISFSVISLTRKYILWEGFYHDFSTKKASVSGDFASGVARAYPGGRLAHPEGQNEEENKKSLRKNEKHWLKFEEKMRKVELLPTWDCEAGYGPGLCPLTTTKGAQPLGPHQGALPPGPLR